jgi:MFS family permease
VAEATPAKKTAWQMMVQYFRDFGVLRDNPKAYWAIQAINFLDCIAYFSFMGIAAVFLRKEMGWDDVNAGYIYSSFTMLVTISLFFVGFVTDALGVRRATILTMAVSLAARAGIAACGLLTELPHREWIVIAFFLLASPGMAMSQTLFQAANRRFSSRRSRSASFNMWYLVMNVGAMIGGYSIDVVRLRLALGDSWIYAFGAATTALALLVGFLLVWEERQAEAAAEAATDSAGESPRLPGEDRADRFIAWMKAHRTVAIFAFPAVFFPAVLGVARRFLVLILESAFWRFIVLMVSVLGVRAVFLYFSLLMPVYWTRVIGEDVQMGLLQSINPFCIIVGLVLFIPIAHRFHVFKMLVVGATISAVSIAVLVLPWGLFGQDMARAYFAMSIVSMVICSIGEMLWSPKLQEYTAAIAPKGQEGAYFGLSMMPWFVAKLIVSSLSGHMLVRWCPEGIGPSLQAGTLGFWHRPEAMWLVLFLWALAGPTLAWVLRGWLTKGADLDAKAPASA